MWMFLRKRKFEKTGEKTEKSNYRPTSLFSDFSKIYERCSYDQIYSFYKIFSGNQCGFRKEINTQHILLAMIQIIKISLGNKQFCAAVTTDLSIAFNYIITTYLLLR